MKGQLRRSEMNGAQILNCYSERTRLDESDDRYIKTRLQQ